MQTKVCSKCKIGKPHSEYYRDSGKGRKIRCRCKACCNADVAGWREKNRSEYNNYAAAWRAKNPERQHATDIKRHYKLSIDQYNEMLTAQACGCKICGKQHDPSLKRGRLYVDHCHDTGDVRGLLCGACNSAIGYFNHDVEIMRKAITYINSISSR